jgi:hypothetical protein
VPNDAVDFHDDDLTVDDDLDFFVALLGLGPLGVPKKTASLMELSGRISAGSSTPSRSSKPVPTQRTAK